MMYSVSCSHAEDSNLAAAFSMVKRKSVVVPEPHEKALPTGMMRDMMERHHLNSPMPKLKRGRSSSSLQAASPAGSQGLPFQAYTPSPGAKQISIREVSKILSAVAKEKNVPLSVLLQNSDVDADETSAMEAYLRMNNHELIMEAFKI